MHLQLIFSSRWVGTAIPAQEAISVQLATALDSISESVHSQPQCGENTVEYTGTAWREAKGRLIRICESSFRSNFFLPAYTAYSVFEDLILSAPLPSGCGNSKVWTRDLSN